MAIIFNVGLNDKVTHKQEVSLQDAVTLIANIVGDCTIKTGNIGVYTHADGSRVVEDSIEVVAYEMDMQQAQTVAKQLATSLNQEAIAVSEQVLNTVFIG